MTMCIYFKLFVFCVVCEILIQDGVKSNALPLFMRFFMGVIQQARTLWIKKYFVKYTKEIVNIANNTGVKWGLHLLLPFVSLDNSRDGETQTKHFCIL